MIPWIVARLLSLVPVGPVATCPRGYYVEGVRPTGETSCVETPPGLENEPPASWVAKRWPIRVLCKPGHRAVVVHARKVGCR